LFAFLIFPGLKQLKLRRFLAVHAASDNKVAEIRSRIGEAKAPGMFGRFETIGCHVCHGSFKLNNQQKTTCFCLTKKKRELVVGSSHMTTMDHNQIF